MQGPRLYRFFNYEQIVYVPAPVGGWNPDANPWELPADQAPILKNFLIRSGKVSARGGITAISDLSGSISPIYMAGAVLGQPGFLLLSQKAPSATAYVDPWNAPRLGTSSAKLAGGVTTMWYVSTSTGTPTSLGATPDQVIGPRWVNFDGLMYGIAYDSASGVLHDAGNSYFMKALPLLTLVQTGAAGPTVLSNAPHGAFDLKGHLGRIWLLGGCDTPGGSTTHLSNALFFTNGVNTTAGVGSATSDWQDPVAGTTNIIKMDNNTADHGVALATVRSGLLILRRSSLWFLKGTTTANFDVFPISKEAGCIDARSVVETDHGVYFMSQKGLMLTDGVKVVNVSASVLYTIQQAINMQQGAVTNGQGGWVSCALTSDGQILVSIGIYSASSTGTLIPLWSGLYDPNIVKGGAWTQITSQVWSTEMVNDNYGYPGLLVASGVPGQLYAIGDKYVTQLEERLNGNTSFLVTGGSPYLYDKLPSGGTPYISIPYVWETKLYPISGVATNTRRFGIARRYFVDYVFAGSGLVPTIGWSITPVGAQGNSYGATVNAPLGALSANSSIALAPNLANPSIQRENVDFTPEIDDLGFLVTWSDGSQRASAPSAAAADIYGIGLEWQKSRDRR